MLNNILEISKRAAKNGRVPIKIALLKIHDTPDETNKNGLHWVEEYVDNARKLADIIPICAEFSDDKKEVPLGHGMTGEMVNEDGNLEPVFENSETVGIINETSIETVNLAGVNTRVLCGSGYLFNQRYPNFVKWVRQKFALEEVETSIEIMGLESNNNKIVYEEDTPTQEKRTPKEFCFTGVAILSVEPADENAVVLEVAQKTKKEESIDMDEKELKELIRSTIAESNSRNEELSAEITELNDIITEKDNTISELNATVEQVQKALDDLNKEREIYWKEREILENELAKVKAEARIGELSAAIAEFTEDEQKYAESEINAFKENPVEGDIDGIVCKIYAGIGQASKATIAEQNSVADDRTLDIFAEVNSSDDLDDVNIF